MRSVWVVAAVFSAACGGVAAEPAPSSAPAAPPSAATPIAAPAEAGAPVTAAPSDSVRLAADTPVRIELAEAVGSKGRTRGDKFVIRLAAPIVVDGRTVAPAGALGQGEVVYAEAGGGGGSPGKLVLAARYIDVGAVRVRLKAFKLASAGESELVQMEIAAQFISLAAMLIPGHNVLYPAGTRAGAKVAEDVVLTAEAPALAPPAPSPEPVTQPVTAPSAAPAIAGTPAGVTPAATSATPPSKEPLK